MRKFLRVIAAGLIGLSFAVAVLALLSLAVLFLLDRGSPEFAAAGGALYSALTTLLLAGIVWLLADKQP